MKKIEAEIVADSVNSYGDRITTMLLTYPRFIHGEVLTHRVFSKNSASSRAIPFEKMVKMVEEDPFIPIAWQKDHKGIQGTEYFTDELSIQFARSNWLTARDNAIKGAMSLHSTDNGYGSVTKQLCNRLLEPFMWTTMLITGSKEGWDNFFKLRCPQYTFDNVHFYKSKKEAIDIITDGKGFLNKEYELSDLDWLKVNKGQAEIHMMTLAEAIYDAMNKSTPKQLKAGEWHIPFEDKISYEDFMKGKMQTQDLLGQIQRRYEFMIKVSCAMAARTSYTVVGDERELDYKKMISLHDRLLSQDPPHSSPLEHCARAMSKYEYTSFYRVEGFVKFIHPEAGVVYKEKISRGWCKNYKGFISYRYMIDNKYDTSNQKHCYN